MEQLPAAPRPRRPRPGPATDASGDPSGQPHRSSLDRADLARADLPSEFTPETVRALPISVLQRLRDHRNTVLDEADQRDFDQALQQVMGQTAQRLSQQLDRAGWERVAREAQAPGGGRWQGRADGPSGRGDSPASRRIARRIERQLKVAQQLAPELDWSFANAFDAAEPTATDHAPAGPDVQDTAEEPAPDDTSAARPVTPDRSDDDSIGDLEEQVSDQVELVQAMSEVAEISRRTYALEQQRDLESTRGVFFGFLVSAAVILAGWAPVVTAPSWSARWWMLGLTLATCLVAGLVYVLIRRRQPSPAE